MTRCRRGAHESTLELTRTVSISSDSSHGDWSVVKTVRNPWGQIPLTAGGRSLPGRAQQYVGELRRQAAAADPVSRRHHYVPKTYLKAWSFDGRRIWAFDTTTGVTKPLGLADVCVKENLYRVVGADGHPHNRVELLFGVVDAELRRVQQLFATLEDPDSLEFDDLIGLGLSMATQRMRTIQEQRLSLQYNKWLVAQNSEQHKPFEDENNPYRTSGIMTELLFDSMWSAADVLTMRQIEVWDDPEGRFMTCDAPVQVPLRSTLRPDLVSAPYVIWPVSPHRVVALSNDLVGEKAVIRQADGKRMGIVRRALEDGRERMIFASGDQRHRLPQAKQFRRRVQSHFRCSRRTPQGEPVPPPGCCVQWSVALATGPVVNLCNQGLHSPAPDMWTLC